jgi:hypothetical protein
MNPPFPLSDLTLVLCSTTSQFNHEFQSHPWAVMDAQQLARGLAQSSSSWLQFPFVLKPRSLKCQIRVGREL